MKTRLFALLLALTVYAPAGPTPFSVLANDSDPDLTTGGLTVTSASLVSGSGSVSFSASTVTLTPPADFIGQMVATYTIVDGGGLRSTSTVTESPSSALSSPPSRLRRMISCGK